MGQQAEPVAGRAERGQVLILMVLVMTVVFLIGALAIDVGLWLAERRGLQRAADFAALAGSVELPDDPAEARVRALEWASRNGYTDGVNGVEVEVEMLCSNGLSNPPPDLCDNPTPSEPSVCMPEVGCDSMRVIIHKPGALPFTSMFGVDDVIIGSGAAAQLAFDVIPLDSVLLLDQTGSMGVNSSGNTCSTQPGCPIREAKLAAQDFVGTLLEDPNALSQVGYAPYRGCYNPPRQNSNCTPGNAVINLTQNTNSLQNGINATNAQGGSGTNICLAFRKAQEMFDSPQAQDDENTRRSIVILTDGDITYNEVAWGNGQPPTVCRPNTSPQTGDPEDGTGCHNAQTRERQLDVKTRQLVNVLKAPPYQADVWVVGFGVCGSASSQLPTNSYCSGIGNTSHDNTADRRLLKCIASSTPGTNDHYFEVASASDLPEVFQVIAWQIAARALSE